MSTHPTSPSRKAFTLIELLVVIAIIALLAAILFPVFGRARESARRSSCLSNMKQIGLGLMQYSQDYDETLPAAHNPTGTATGKSWAVVIFPYVKSTQIFMCPSNDAKTLGMSYQGPTGDKIDIRRSYAANENIIKSYTSDPAPGLPLSAMPNPAVAIAIGESASNLTFIDMSKTWSKTQGLFAGHMGTSNFVFADGHAKNYRPLQTVAPGSSPGNYNPDNMWTRMTATSGDLAVYNGSTGCPGVDKNSISSVNNCYRLKLGQAEELWQ